MNMYYTVIGILATAVLLIENHDILLDHNDDNDEIEKPEWNVYRNFLFAVLFYYATDIAWGLFESLKLQGLLFANTTIYFFAMASGVYFWAQYIVAYLDDKSQTGKYFILAGRSIAGLILVCNIINIFTPLVFTVDENSVYSALPVRDGMLVCQIVLLVAISLYAGKSLSASDGKKNRYSTIMFFGLIMAFFLTIQLWYPYLPLYSIAYMLGTCLLRTFVINDEREEHRRLRNSIAELKKKLKL